MCNVPKTTAATAVWGVASEERGMTDQTVVAAPSGDLGPRRLTLIHAIGQGLGIGPIFSAGAVTGLVAAVAGFNTPLSIVFGNIGALGIAYAISLYARRWAGAGAM